MATTRRIFETGLERLGRTIANQYDINVVFQGTGAYTDGKTITLPSTDELTDELMQDLNGFLDHEVGHCRFTDFEQLKKLMVGKGCTFQKELLNGIEDVRIERDMIKEYPGCRHNLEPLYVKMRGQINDKWSTLPWPFRFIVSVADAMSGRPLMLDAETTPLFEKTGIAKLVDSLNAATTTSQLRQIAEVITRRLLDHFDDQPEDGKGSEDDEKKEGKSGKDGGKGESGKDGKPSKAKGKPEGKSSPGEGKGKAKGKPGTADPVGREMLMDDSAEGSPDWDRADLTVDDMVKRELAEHFKEVESKPLPSRGSSRRERDTRPHLPFTTRFDREIDLTGKGDAVAYAKIRTEGKSMVAGIKRSLERHLKVKENRKWLGERERGSIDTRALSRLATDQNYRRPFKAATKVETNNVAVQILVDLSGSMANGHGASKMAVARIAVSAIAEALHELKVPFEITGFTSERDSDLMRVATGENIAPYNRSRERLDKFIFKSFEGTSLNGITKMKAIAENPDGEAVRWAANRLSMQRQKRKVLFVFSDGSPATSDGDPRILNNDLCKAVETTMKSGMEVVGFGVLTDAVRHFYPQHVVIDDLKTLPTKVMNELAKLLKG